MNKIVFVVVMLLSQIFSAPDTWKTYQYAKAGMLPGFSPIVYDSNYTWDLCTYPPAALEKQNMLVQFDGENWVHYNYENSGLPDQTYYSLAMESDSILWLAAVNHLVKFDHKRRTVTSLPVQLNTKEITTNFMGVSPKGVIWAGVTDTRSYTDAGIICYDHGAWQRFDSTNSTLYRNYALESFFDSTGKTLFTWGTLDGTAGAMSIYDGETWLHYDTSNSSLPSNIVELVLADKQKGWWVGTNTGLAYISDTGVVTWDTFGLDQCKVTSIKQISNGEVWVSKEDSAGHHWVSVWNGTRWIEKDIEPLWIEYGIYAVYPLENGEVIGITRGNHGFCIQQNQDWQFLDFSTTQGTLSVPEAAFANGYYNNYWRNAIWLITDHPYLTLCKYENNSWTEYTPFNTNLANDTIHTITSDQSNTTFISTNYGISRFDGKNWFAWNSSTVGMKRVTSLFADRKGNLWGGNNSSISSGGLVQFDGKTWKMFTMQNSELPSPEIYDLTEDTNGTLWISHREGVSTFDGTDWNHWKTGTTFPSMAAMGGLARDSSGTMWVATGKGAFRYDGSTWSSFDSAKGSIPSNYLLDVAVDSSGAIWFGSLYAGAIRFDGKTSQSFTPKGIKDIRTLSADRFGNVWAATDSGAIKFTKDQWIVYDTANSELSSNRIGSIAIGRDGSKWFGTKFNGIAQLIDDDSVATTTGSNSTVPLPRISIAVTSPTITISGVYGSGTVDIVDLRGRVIANHRIEAAGAAAIPLALAPGIYAARVQFGTHLLIQKILWQ